MNVFTQLVLVVGRISPHGVQMLGTGFIVRNDGRVVTTYHVSGPEDTNLVVLIPHITNLDVYQDLADAHCQPIPVQLSEIDPVKDLAILRGEFKFAGDIPELGSFDRNSVGEELHIFGFPHCVEGRRALTFQKAEIGAKVFIDSAGVKSKHAVINVQARPGQSGSMVFSPKTWTVSGVLIGAWIPAPGGISLGGINPRELHQTTHCISAEYVKEML